MALPIPIPDNPLRWDGWKNYNSANYYDRLCLDFDSNPNSEQIEENCRQLLVWWQKKLPLKNQPSNPLAQMLRAGLDEAPQYLAEARTKLLDADARIEIDRVLREQIVAGAVNEFKKILPFAIGNGFLTAESEQRLYQAGGELGLLREEMREVIDVELEKAGAVRGEQPQPAAPAASSGESASGGGARDPFEEFRRMLRLSKLCLDGDDMTDDQRDALCNMGESLGLTGGQAEDLIDEYLEEVAVMPAAPIPAGKAAAPPARPPAAAPVSRQPTPAPVRPAPAAPARPAAEAPAARKAPEAAAPAISAVNTSPVARMQERGRYPNFTNGLGMEMLLVTSGTFFMGSADRDAAPHEQPLTQTTVSCFYMARFPVTNRQYELFDPSHRSSRAPWANDDHPVIYVNSKDAIAFAQWLSQKEGRKYRLPTEAEWEYAARGTDGRAFPWGDRLDAGHFANFADRRTTFAWREPQIDDGYAETAPVGSYPKGASSFGVEDMSGNVFEWCLDYFEPYRGKPRTNPKPSASGSRRVYRGGSWKSRISTLRASARGFNTPEYLSNDVSFRLICECE